MDAKFSIDHKPNRQSKFDFNFSWSRHELATTLLTETGTASGTGSVDTFSSSIGGTHNLTHVDTLSWSVKGSTVSYTDATNTPYFDYATNVALYHRISAATVLTNTINFDWLDSEDAAKSQRLFWNPMTGFQSQVSRRLNIIGAVGGAFSNSYQLNPIAVSTAAPSPIGTSTASQGFVSNLSFNYKLTHNMQALLKLSQSVSPSVLGTEQNIRSIGLTVTRNINARSRISFSSQYSQNHSSGTSADLFTANANYEYRLTREWRSNISLTYRQRDDANGFVSSEAIMLALIGDFSVYGKRPPKATNSAELARRQQQAAQQALPSVIPYSAPEGDQAWPDVTPDVVPSTDF